MEKSPFIKKSPEIKSYQFETLFSRTFFLAPVWFYTKKSSEKKSSNKWKFMTLYWQPSYYFRKKSPMNPKHRTLFPVTFFPRTWENSDFFSQDFLTEILWINPKPILLIPVNRPSRISSYTSFPIFSSLLSLNSPPHPKLF